MYRSEVLLYRIFDAHWDLCGTLFPENELDTEQYQMCDYPTNLEVNEIPFYFNYKLL